MTLSWEVESVPPDTFGTGPDEEQRSTVDGIYVESCVSLDSLQKIVWSVACSGVSLTIQAAWTASDRFPASGSHQNT